MATRKAQTANFPEECCGVCKFALVSPNREGDDLTCWALPPTSVGETDDNGAVVAMWMRGGYVAPQMPACMYFKPRLHA